MSFYKNFLLVIFFLGFFSQVSFADDTDQANVAEEELPLNNPFQGKLSTKKSSFRKSKKVVSVTTKLVGLISEKFSEFILKKIKSSATTGLSIISSV